jgi:hypothetical protein
MAANGIGTNAAASGGMANCGGMVTADGQLMAAAFDALKCLPPSVSASQQNAKCLQKTWGINKYGGEMGILY